MNTDEQLLRNSMQISYVNEICHHGIVSEYLKEVRRNKAILNAKRQEAISIVQEWRDRRFRMPSSLVMEECKKYTKKIHEVSADELKGFIYVYQSRGFDRAISKLYEL